MVYNITEHAEALDFWLGTFNIMHNKHASCKQKRVKSVPKPKLFTKELQEAVYLRDFLKKHGQQEDSNKLGNAINSQKRAANKKYIQNNSKSIWSENHQLTKKVKQQVNFNISVEQLNGNFSTVAKNDHHKKKPQVIMH